MPIRIWRGATGRQLRETRAGPPRPLLLRLLPPQDWSSQYSQRLRVGRFYWSSSSIPGSGLAPRPLPPAARASKRDPADCEPCCCGAPPHFSSCFPLLSVRRRGHALHCMVGWCTDAAAARSRSCQSPRGWEPTVSERTGHGRNL